MSPGLADCALLAAGLCMLGLLVANVSPSQEPTLLLASKKTNEGRAQELASSRRSTFCIVTACGCTLCWLLGPRRAGLAQAATVLGGTA